MQSRSRARRQHQLLFRICSPDSDSTTSTLAGREASPVQGDENVLADATDPSRPTCSKRAKGSAVSVQLKAIDRHSSAISGEVPWCVRQCAAIGLRLDDQVETTGDSGPRSWCNRAVAMLGTGGRGFMRQMGRLLKARHILQSISIMRRDARAKFILVRVAASEATNDHGFAVRQFYGR